MYGNLWHRVRGLGFRGEGLLAGILTSSRDLGSKKSVLRIHVQSGVMHFTSQVLSPLMELGTCKAGSGPYVQSFRACTSGSATVS